VKRKQVTNAYL